ncbi:MAG TPA: radical SAM protein, partial [Terriglobales bacterium]|nr:radical SAM protein [Terriglobales bacterium]
MRRFYVQNFGCRATQADGAVIERQFVGQGLRPAVHSAEADIVVINSCTVTAEADRDARAAIRRIRRGNPKCQIVVTGCYAQRAPQEVAALPGVSHVIGNSHKHELANILQRAFVPLSSLQTKSQEFRTENWEPGTENRVFVSDIFAHTELLAAPVFEAAGESNETARTRPNLKVQDGCGNRCSFCIIPSVRGHSRSLPLEEVIREVNALVDAGYREVVISGINLGRWGCDLEHSTGNEPHGDSRPRLSRRAQIPRDSAAGDFATTNFEAQDPAPRDLGWRIASSAAKEIVAPSTASANQVLTSTHARSYRFEDLVRAILNQTSLEKLRISSVEPMDWSDQLISLMAESPRIAKHAHVPMQSASDAVLRRMHRRYRPWHYREKIEKIRAAMPTAAIGADVMVGFPGETDAEFEETRRTIEHLPFTYLHVFTYSARPGTPAAVMPNQVPLHVARERNRILRDLAAQKKLVFMRSFIGGT